jgi:hypothetical protein
MLACNHGHGAPLMHKEAPPGTEGNREGRRPARGHVHAAGRHRTEGSGGGSEKDGLARLARRARKRIPDEAKALDFNRRLQALRQLISRMRDPLGIQRDALLELLPKIANANGIRQKLVHGIWSFDPRQPNRLLSRSRKGLGIPEQLLCGGVCSFLGRLPDKLLETLHEQAFRPNVRLLSIKA